MNYVKNILLFVATLTSMLAVVMLSIYCIDMAFDAGFKYFLSID